MQRAVAALLVILLAGITIACSGGGTSASAPGASPSPSPPPGPTPGSVTGVFVYPGSVTVGVNGSTTLSAAVSYDGNLSPNLEVTWSLQEGAAGGTIAQDGTNRGVYTASGNVGTFHVVATSVADTTKTGTAVVTVISTGFSATGSLSIARTQHTATLLADGRVLVVGGKTNGANGLETLATAEIYDPATDTFTSTGSMAAARSSHTATLLQDGRVLVAGGADQSGVPLASAELYDPASGSFTSTGGMGASRDFHAAALLANGMVLVTGGFGASGDSLATAELFDPGSANFSAVSDMGTARAGHTATTLQDGKVLVAGGVDASDSLLSSAEIFDPAIASFGPTGSLALARASHTATLLPDGSVLMAGGLLGINPVYTEAEVFHQESGSFTASASMTTVRNAGTATLLPDGTVLFAGGYENMEDCDAGMCSGYLSAVNSSGERFAGDAFTATLPMGLPRSSHTATLLRDGRVLIVGGSSSRTYNAPHFDAPTNALATAETYGPLP